MIGHLKSWNYAYNSLCTRGFYNLNTPFDAVFFGNIVCYLTYKFWSDCVLGPLLYDKTDFLQRERLVLIKLYALYRVLVYMSICTKTIWKRIIKLLPKLI